MADRIYRSHDHRYGAKISQDLVAKMIHLWAQAGVNETGGILVGGYTEALDCAVIRGISDPPSDSRRGHTWFIRGVLGLQSWIDRLWSREQQYYLGEWHFHPHAAADPSSTDIRQMDQIAKSIDYHCPEPLLAIVGGDPPGHWKLCIFVFPKDAPYQELKPADAPLDST